ncbi:MAG: hypothetical protein J5J00_08105, partial [Deltaproteobacteria bacterium]|nr:hypothetical protein [Deltaproteobacteria bacterium]
MAGFTMLDPIETNKIREFEGIAAKEILRVLVASASLDLARTLRQISNGKAGASLEVHWTKDLQFIESCIAEREYNLFILDYAVTQARTAELACAIDAPSCSAAALFVAEGSPAVVKQRALSNGMEDFLMLDHLTPTLLEQSIQLTLSRKRAASESRLLLNFQRFLADLSAQLIGVPPEEINQALQEALDQIEKIACLKSVRILLPHFGDGSAAAIRSRDSDVGTSRILSVDGESDELRKLFEQGDAVKVLTKGDLHDLAGVCALLPDLNQRDHVFACELTFRHNSSGCILLAADGLSQIGLNTLLSALPSFSRLVSNILDRYTEHLSRKRAEQAFRTILEGTASTTADDFFRSLVRHLALILDTKFAFIARFSENNTREMRTLAVWRDNE